MQIGERVANRHSQMVGFFVDLSGEFDRIIVLSFFARPALSRCRAFLCAARPGGVLGLGLDGFADNALLDERHHVGPAVTDIASDLAKPQSGVATGYTPDVQCFGLNVQYFGGLGFSE